MTITIFVSREMIDSFMLNNQLDCSDPFMDKKRITKPVMNIQCENMLIDFSSSYSISK